MPVMAVLRWAPLVQAVTSALYCAAAVWGGWPFDPTRGLLALGGLLLAWPLFEWSVHRLFLHGVVPDQHRQHHVDPRGDLSVVPPIIDLLLAAVFLVMALVLGWRNGSAAFAGFVLGYALYNGAHWCIHAGRWPHGGWFDAVAHRHALHHHGEEVNYNVLLPVGDWLFRTYRTPTR